jgi:hypothetical protein
LFINITLGTILIISGRQFVWSMVKGAMILVSAAASFWLMPYWQARAGNGGIGAAMLVAIAELGMLTAAIVLVPRGLMEGFMLADLLRAMIASGAMVAAAHFLAGAPLVVGLVAAPLAYLVAQLAVGGIGARDLSFLRDSARGAIGSRG